MKDHDFSLDTLQNTMAGLYDYCQMLCFLFTFIVTLQLVMTADNSAAEADLFFFGKLRYENESTSNFKRLSVPGAFFIITAIVSFLLIAQPVANLSASLFNTNSTY